MLKYCLGSSSSVSQLIQWRHNSGFGMAEVLHEHYRQCLREDCSRQDGSDFLPSGLPLIYIATLHGWFFAGVILLFHPQNIETAFSCYGWQGRCASITRFKAVPCASEVIPSSTLRVGIPMCYSDARILPGRQNYQSGANSCQPGRIHECVCPAKNTAAAVAQRKRDKNARTRCSLWWVWLC